MNNDPIADMLTRIRNANTAHHESVTMPSSTVKSRIAAILQQEGYIAGFRVDENANSVGKTLTIDLKFGPNRERSIAGLRRVSKPGLRVYKGRDDIPKVMNGLGVAILSTSRGVIRQLSASPCGLASRKGTRGPRPAGP